MYGLRLFFVVDRFVAMQKNPGRRLFIFMQLVFLVLLPTIHVVPIIFILKLNVKIAHSAHIGGGLVGFLCGIYMLDCPCISEHCFFPTACRRIAFVLLAFYCIIGLALFFVIDVPIVNHIWYKSGYWTDSNGTVFDMAFIRSNGTVVTYAL